MPEHPDSPRALPSVQRRLGVAVLIAVLIAAASVVTALAVRGDVNDDRERSFRRLAEETRGAIERRLASYSEALFGLSVLFAPGAEPTRADFSEALVAYDAFARFPGVQAFSFNRRMGRADVAAYEAAVRADTSLNGVGYPDFSVRTGGDAEDLYVVDFLEPLEPNAAAFGFDIFSEESRRSAVEEARDSGELIVTEPVVLVQSERGPDTKGFLMMLPVYDHDGPPRTGPERRRTITGVLVAVVNGPDLVDGLLQRNPSVAFEVYDVGPTVEPPTSIDEDGFLLAAGDPPHAAGGETRDGSRAVLDVDARGRRWRIVATPGPGFVESTGARSLPLLIGFGGAGVGLLLAGSYYVVATTQARRREEAFSSYLEVTPDAVVVVNQRGDITHANANAEELFGYARHELVGRPVEMLIVEDMRNTHIAHRARYVANPSVRPMGEGLDLRGRHRDGHAIDVDVRLAPVRTEEGVRFSAVIRDATQRRAAQRAMAQALEREQAALERARDADRLKDEFLDITAHELRTPLMSIAGFTDLLVRRGASMDEERRADLLARVGENADDMAEMVERLLNVSRLSAGRVDVTSERVDLRLVVEGAVSTLGPRLGRRSIEIDVPPGLAAEADTQGVAHVVGNLLSNAAKFTDAEGHITVRARQDGNMITVGVADDGVGIDPDDIDRLFERFFQGSVQAENARGTGVGLSIVQRYLELMGGAVSVESEPGAGATFTFTLPAAGPDPRSEDTA